MPVEKNPFKAPELNHYFSTLPAALQESIEQSGIKFTSLEHLQAFVRNLNQQ